MTFEAAPRRRALCWSVAFGLAFVGLERCGGYEPGIEVQVALQAAPSTLSFESDLGFAISLEEAVLAIDSLELIACSPSASAATLEFLSMRSAYAHVEERPTASDTVTPLDALHSGGLAVVATVLRPPPGRYCSMRVVLKGTERTSEAVGLRVRGTARRAGTDHGFDMAAYGGRSVEAPLSETLVLSATNLTAAVTLVADQRRWLDGINFERDASEEDRRARVVENALGGLTAQTHLAP